jgi:hypothetical protein
MDFARAAVEAEALERSEAKKRKRSAEAEGADEGGAGSAPPRPRPRPAGGGETPREANAREAKARREAHRRLEAGAEATEEVALARAEERGGGPAATGAGQPRPGFTAFNMDEEKDEGGGFDEGGAFHREGRSRPDAEEEGLEQAEVVGGEVAQRHLAAVGAAAGSGDLATPPSEVQLAGLKRRLGGLLREGETVARALQRCGGGSRSAPWGSVRRPSWSARGGQRGAAPLPPRAGLPTRRPWRPSPNVQAPSSGVASTMCTPRAAASCCGRPTSSLAPLAPQHLPVARTTCSQTTPTARGREVGDGGGNLGIGACEFLP